VSAGGWQPSGPPERLSATSDSASIPAVRAAAQEAARRAGFPEPDVASIELAINEAVANVIRHGYEGRAGQPIDVTIQPVRRAAQTGLQITVCDCGRQVDPSTICGRDLDDVRPGGLGTHIMNAIMDEVEYTQRQPEGMELRLLKIMSAPPTGSEGRNTDSAREDATDGKR
jgi:anti-sigma regulatory factor (Ser/Thr protein kinase)